MFVIKHHGNFQKTTKFLTAAARLKAEELITPYALQGVRALSDATPFDSGETAFSWNYEIKVSRNGVKIYWTNSNVNKGVPIAILLQYGHGTGTGGYVQGRDYINPAIKPVFDAIADNIWKEVSKL